MHRIDRHHHRFASVLQLRSGRFGLPAESFLEESLRIKSSLNLTEKDKTFFKYPENYKNVALVRLAQNRRSDALQLTQKLIALMELDAGLQAATHSFLFHHANLCCSVWGSI